MVTIARDRITTYHPRADGAPTTTQPPRADDGVVAASTPYGRTRATH